MSRKLTKNILSILAIIWLATGLVSAQKQRHTLSEPKLGTVANLVYYANEDFNHHGLKNDFFGLIDSFNQIFSDYETQSEVNKLGRKGHRAFSDVSDPFFELVEYAHSMAEASDGKFDITIGALTRLWRPALRQGKVPRRKHVRKARKSVGYQNLQLDTIGQKVRLHKKGMKLDFGGIAKGYIADHLAKLLDQYRIKQYLIDLGGDIKVGDPPPGAPGWTIAIEWASQTIQISNTSVATSGPDYQFFIFRGKRYSHIIDPLTGWGIANPFNTTIICKKAWMADALASIGALIPPEETLHLLMTLKEVDGVMQKSGLIYQSKGFQRYVLPNSKN